MTSPYAHPNHILKWHPDYDRNVAQDATDAARCRHAEELKAERWRTHSAITTDRWDYLGASPALWLVARASSEYRLFVSVCRRRGPTLVRYIVPLSQLPYIVNGYVISGDDMSHEEARRTFDWCERNFRRLRGDGLMLKDTFHAAITEKADKARGVA